MRKLVVAGNWKMNCTVDEAVALTMDLVDRISDRPTIDTVICPPFIDIPSVSMICKTSDIKVGAQNMFAEEKGAYTGEISYTMIRDFCKYVILGHSERRMILGETSETINNKVEKAIQNGLTPIVCIGETLAENEAGITQKKLALQIEESLSCVNKNDDIIIAYEPIWAIGTGKAATSDQAEETLKFIRTELANRYGDEFAAKTRILYGGSVKASNAKEIMSKPNIDGVLVGGASLKAEEFAAISDAAIEIKK